MPEYRAFIVGPDGYFSGSKRWSAAMTQKAIERAERLVEGHDVELWNGARPKLTMPQRSPQCHRLISPKHRRRAVLLLLPGAASSCHFRADAFGTAPIQLVRKSGGPPPLERSFKVKRDYGHRSKEDRAQLVQIAKSYVRNLEMNPAHWQGAGVRKLTRGPTACG
jgi:hypothetical protein